MTTFLHTSAPAPRTLKEYFAQPGAMKQRELGGALNVSQSAMSMLANRKRGASGQLALRIHRITGVPIEELVLVTPRRATRRTTTRRRRRRR